MYAPWNLKGAPHTDPAMRAPNRSSELLGWGPQWPRTPRCCMAEPQVTAGGAGGPRDLRPILPASPCGGGFPPFWGRDPACVLEMEEGSLIALSIVAWGRGGPLGETFAPFSLGFCLLEPEKTFKDLLILIPRALKLY